MKRNWRNKILILLVAVISLTGISSTNSDFEISKNLDIFASLYRELNQNYVDEIQPGELMKIAIDEMLASLDPYTNYIPESDIEDYRFMTTGQYGGIGALIQKQDSYIVITEPYENFPAQKEGLMAGDIILKINGKSIEGKNSSEISDLLKGQPGTEIKLEIQRGVDGKIMNFTLTREEIKVNNIPYYAMVDEKVGYIKLNSFTMNAGNEVKQAFLSLKGESPNMEGIILDLRGNGGGLLSEAVNIANIFVDKGQLIVSTKGKLSDSNHSYRTLNAAVDKNIRLAIMVDGYSASASEIVAGSIQDLDRGVIIGQKSYGKGLVQNIVPLPYNTKIKITIAKYYIPSGRCIQAIDYSKRQNGKAMHYSDSLKKTFYTENGRMVYDQGGIIPDLVLKPDSLSDIAISLYLNNHIFNFASLYTSKHDKIAPAAEFIINDNDYNAFLSYISNKEYDYTTNTERKLGELAEAMKEDKYYETFKNELDNLQTAVQHNKEEDLENFKEEIKKLISNEIVSRYYYQKGRIQFNIEHDPEIKETVRLLLNAEEYNQILSGK
ncbi:MAG: S41 family peptidase [Bacteroidales bacterium]|nr:S41 family peptidase [Bacteroidales bacterium]